MIAFRQRLGYGYFFHGVFGERNTYGIAQTIFEQSPYAHGRLDASIFAIAGCL
jgi:hypothetical protein